MIIKAFIREMRDVLVGDRELRRELAAHSQDSDVRSLLDLVTPLTVCAAACEACAVGRGEDPG